MHKWLNKYGIYPQTWPRKSDVPYSAGAAPIRLDFGIHGLAWALRSLTEPAMLAKSGVWFRVHYADLHTGSVAGPCDLTSADGTVHAEGWRASLSAAQLRAIVQ